MLVEALISSLLVVFAFCLAIQAGHVSNPLVDLQQYQLLEDYTALAYQKNLSAGECALLFSSDKNFCYSCRWVSSSTQFISDGPAYSDSNCAQVFSSSTNILQTSQGAYRGGDLQFIYISKTRR